MPSDLEEKLLAKIIANNLEVPVREYKFHKKRQWRFDFAYPDRKIAVEVEGGLYQNRVKCHKCGCFVMMRTKTGKFIPVYQGGGHNTGAGFEKDVEKYNEAASLGWTLIRVTRKMITSGAAIETIKNVLERSY